MMRNLEWFDGAPDELKVGMMVVGFNGAGMLIGDTDPELCGDPASDECIDLTLAAIERWCWVIKPHELEWAADMAGKHAKGRPEQ